MANDFDSLETSERPRDKAWSNWAKFETEGDKVEGYIRDVFFRPAEGEFAAQRGITLEQDDGSLVNVGIKNIPFILAKTNDYRIGDPLRIVFEATLEPRQKGYKGAKQYGFYGKKVEENDNNPTVRDLYKQDMADGGTAPAKEEDGEDF